MTRRELEEMNTFRELIDAANELDCPEFVEDLYFEDDFNSIVEERASDILSYENWRACRDFFNDLPSDGYDIYYDDGYGEWRGYDNDDYFLDEIKDSIIEYAEENDLFEREEEQEEEQINDEAEWSDVFEFEQEDISFEPFGDDCANELRMAIINRKPKDDENADDHFYEFISA